MTNLVPQEDGLTPEQFIDALIAAQVMPKGLDKPKAMIAAQMGDELGMGLMASVQNIAVINGRPSIYGQGGVALVRGSGHLESMEEHYEGDWPSDDFKAVCEMKRVNQGGIIRGEFSIGDAIRAGFLKRKPPTDELISNKDPWKLYPKRMLQWRARWFAMNDGFADILKGVTFAEIAYDDGPREVEIIRTVDDIKPLPVAIEGALRREAEASVRLDGETQTAEDPKEQDLPF